MSYHSNILTDGGNPPRFPSQNTITTATSSSQLTATPITTSPTITPTNSLTILPTSTSITTLPTLPTLPTSSTITSPTQSLSALSTIPTQQKNNSTQTTPLAPQTTTSNPIFVNMISSGCGSIITGLTMTPLDVLGKRIQAQKLTNPTLNQSTIRGTLQTIVKNEGVGKLWAGLSTGLVMAVPNTITYFSAYEILRSIFVSELPVYQERLAASTWALNHPTVHAALESTALPPFLAGVFSRLFCTTLVAPLELVRTRQQTLLTPHNGSHHGPSMRSIFHDIIYIPQTTNTQNTSSPKKPQFGNLYRGLGTTLLRDVPFSALYWTFNERIKGILTQSNLLCQFSSDPNCFVSTISSQHSKPNDLSQSFGLKERSARQTWAISFISGAIAGTLAAVITHPFEVIKTAQQFQYSAQQLKNHSVDLSKANLFATCSYLTKTRGMKGLFTGLLPRVLKIAPSCAVMLSSYDLAKTLLGGKPNLSVITPSQPPSQSLPISIAQSSIKKKSHLD